MRFIKHTGRNETMLQVFQLFMVISGSDDCNTA